MDVRLASDKARIGFVFGRLGIVPEACLVVVPAPHRRHQPCPRVGLLRRHPHRRGGARGRAGPVGAPGRRAARRGVRAGPAVHPHRSPVATALARQMMWRNSAQPHPLEAHRVDSLAMFYTSRGDGKEGVAGVPREARPRLHRAYDGPAAVLPLAGLTPRTRIIGGCGPSSRPGPDPAGPVWAGPPGARSAPRAPGLRASRRSRSRRTTPRRARSSGCSGARTFGSVRWRAAPVAVAAAHVTARRAAAEVDPPPRRAAASQSAQPGRSAQLRIDALGHGQQPTTDLPSKHGLPSGWQRAAAGRRRRGDRPRPGAAGRLRRAKRPGGRPGAEAPDPSPDGGGAPDRGDRAGRAAARDAVPRRTGCVLRELRGPSAGLRGGAGGGLPGPGGRAPPRGAPARRRARRREAAGRVDAGLGRPAPRRRRARPLTPRTPPYDGRGPRPRPRSEPADS